MMDYNRQLYEATAYLLMLRHDSDNFNVTVSRYIHDNSGVWRDNKVRAVDSIAILLSLERNGASMPADIIGELELNITKLVLEDFPENEHSQIEADLQTAKSVIDWYRTTPDKMT